jgi:hypothetical protein
MTAKRLVVAVLTKLVVTVTFFFGMAGVAVASAYVTTARMDIVQPRWEVNVGAASRTLYPGVDATVPYDVRNGGSHRQSLRATTATIKKDGDSIYDQRTDTYVRGCSAERFVATVGISSVHIPDEVDPGATVHGAVALMFEEHSSPDDACQGVILQIVVTAN